jgi:hypothetical protein
MTDPIDQFLAGYPPDVQAIGQSLREMVKRAKPDAKEVLYARFNHFDYSLSGKLRGRHNLHLPPEGVRPARLLVRRRTGGPGAPPGG